MKATTLPILSGVALTAMSAAGLSHWWTVRQIVAATESGLPVASESPANAAPDRPAKTPPPNQRSLFAKKMSDKSAPTTASSPAKQEFYEALISKMENLQHQNRDLLDQLAETNRDIMKLEFRVDTHSESFRPLPVGEDRPFASSPNGGGPGVLPPRAEPVDLPAFD